MLKSSAFLIWLPVQNCYFNRNRKYSAHFIHKCQPILHQKAAPKQEDEYPHESQGCLAKPLQASSFYTHVLTLGLCSTWMVLTLETGLSARPKATRPPHQPARGPAAETCPGGTPNMSGGAEERHVQLLLSRQQPAMFYSRQYPFLIKIVHNSL